MMNDDLQDEYDEHRSLEEQLTLSLEGLHALKTEPMSVNIVAILALYPRIFLSIVDSPAWTEMQLFGQATRSPF